MLDPGSSLVVEMERCYMQLFSKKSRLINSVGGFFTVTGGVGTYLLREKGLGNTLLGRYFKKAWVGACNPLPKSVIFPMLFMT